MKQLPKLQSLVLKDSFKSKSLSLRDIKEDDIQETIHISKNENGEFISTSSFQKINNHDMNDLKQKIKYSNLESKEYDLE